MGEIRIVFVIDSDIRTGGGSENVILNLCRFKPKDFEVSILQTERLEFNRLGDDIIKDLGEMGVKIHIIRWNKDVLQFLSKNSITGLIKTFILDPLLYKVNSFRTYYRKVITSLGNPQIVYLFNNNFSYFHWDKNIHVIGTTHNWTPKTRGNVLSRLQTYLVSQRLYWRRMSEMHISDTFKDFNPVIKHGFYSLGVDEALMQDKIQERHDKVVFIFYAQLRECKGIRHVIESFSRLEFSDIELHIFGDGELREYVKEAERDPRIKYYGFVPRNFLVEQIKKSDILVYPSICDTFSLSLYEGLCAGLYAIAHKKFAHFPQFQMFVNSGRLLFTDLDDDEIASKMKETILSVKKRWAHSNRSNYIPCMTVKEHSDSFYDFFREIVLRE